MIEFAKRGQLTTNVSASPPSKFKLNPNFSDKFFKVSISDLDIVFPNQVSSKPSEDTVIIIKSKLESSKSFMYCSGFAFHNGVTAIKSNFEQRVSNFSF